MSILSLSDIKVINGQALVQQVKHEGSWCLQIQFRQGIEYFSFYESPKKVIPQWVDAINSSLGIITTDIVDQKKSNQSNPFFSTLTGATGTLSGVTDCLKKASLSIP